MKPASTQRDINFNIDTDADTSTNTNTHDFFGRLYRRLLAATLIGMVLYLGARAGEPTVPDHRESFTILLASR